MINELEKMLDKHLWYPYPIEGKDGRFQLQIKVLLNWNQYYKQLKEFLPHYFGPHISVSKEFIRKLMRLKNKISAKLNFFPAREALIYLKEHAETFANCFVSHFHLKVTLTFEEDLPEYDHSEIIKKALHIGMQEEMLLDEQEEEDPKSEQVISSNLGCFNN